ncbi:MAG: phospholipase D-like domain-containing protein [Thermoplasmatota archaeon]
MKRLVAVILVLLFIIPQPVIAEPEPDIKITEVYYKSYPGCEYVVLSNWGDAGTIEELILTDFEGNLTINDLYFEEGEEIVIAADKEGYKEIWHTEPDLIMYEDFETSGNFKLANTEDELLVYIDGTLSDALYYGDGEGGEGWMGERVETLGYASYAKRKDQDANSAEDWNWSRDWKVGHSDFDLESFSYEGNTTAFVSPDSSNEVMIEFLDQVESSLKIAIYELRNKKITKRIADLTEDGVEVKVLVEGVPVSGLSEEVRICLSQVKKSGGEVYLMGGERYSPYPFLHSKMMIADSERVLISSENFGYNGYPVNPTYGNRGWGVVLENKDIADYYSKVFKSDLRYGDEFIAENIDDSDHNNSYNYLGFYSRSFEPLNMVDKVDVKTVISPDTSKSSILDMIESAEESIYLQQFYIKNWSHGENPFISSIIERAEEGVAVKILLDSTWYNLDNYTNGTGNDGLVKILNSIGDDKEINLEAKLISDQHGLSKVHNKGMIVDESKVLVSSINWNSYSVLQNREAGVIIENEEIGEYFSDVFLSDWRNDIITPIADAGRDIETTVNSVVELKGEYSWDDNNIEIYKWDIDSNGNYEGQGIRYSTIFREPGTYQITLYVEDECGNWDTDTVNVIVRGKESWIDQKEDQTKLPVIPLTGILIIATVIGLWKYIQISRS